MRSRRAAQERHTFNLRLDPDLVKRIDALSGGFSRTAWIEEALRFVVEEVEAAQQEAREREELRKQESG